MARKHRFIPSMEALEHRTVLAGNITASVLGKGLLITGDEAANHFKIDAVGDSAVRITPLNGTTINGQAGSVFLGGIKKDININLKEGDDTLEIGSIYSRQSLRINGGAGDDTLNLKNLRVKKDIQIAGGEGDDLITIDGSKAKRSLIVDAGAGDDLLNVSNSKFKKSTAFNGGEGTDRVGLLGVALGRTTQTANFDDAALTLLPLAKDDTDTLDEGAAATINLANNDKAFQGTLNLASIVITQQPTNGTVTVNIDGTVLYTHNGSDTTSDSFKYTIKDSQGAVTNVATVTLTINPVNDPPVAVNDAATLNEGASSSINVSTNDTDDLSQLDLTSIVITTQPTNGTVTVNNNGTVTYVHNGSETTTDTFSYTIEDQQGNVSNIAAVTLTITPQNDPPVAVNDEDTLDEGATKIINVSSNDTDAENGLNLTSIVITTQPTNGSVVVNADGTVSYTHNGSETTTDTFSYTIKDIANATSNIATVTLTISPQNDAPVAVNDPTNNVNKGASAIFNLASNDTDAENQLDLASIVITLMPTNGSLVVNANGTVTYQHDNSATTSDTFRYTIKDAQGVVSNEGIVTVTINP